MFGGTGEDDDGAQVPWIPVRPGEVAGLIGEYRQAVGAAEALAVALLGAGVDRRELPELTATLDGDGRGCVLVGRLSASTAQRLVLALDRAGRAA